MLSSNLVEELCFRLNRRNVSKLTLTISQISSFKKRQCCALNQSSPVPSWCKFITELVQRNLAWCSQKSFLFLFTHSMSRKVFQYHLQSLETILGSIWLIIIFTPAAYSCFDAFWVTLCYISQWSWVFKDCLCMLIGGILCSALSNISLLFPVLWTHDITQHPSMYGDGKNTSLHCSRQAMGRLISELL